MSDIQNNLFAVRKKIAEYEKKYGRKPGEVKLLAVSKNQSLEKILAAVQAGQLLFGENYLQEALPKMLALAAENLEWHFIGPLQSNKTRKVAEHFDWVHSVCDKKIAQRLNDQRPSHLANLNICLQINIDRSLSKSGILLDDLLPFVQFCSSLPRLTLRGLMTIPDPKNNFAEERAAFRKLKDAWLQLREKGFNVDTLSMGMSDDMEAAIAENATMVRIGTKIFGERDATK